MSDRIRQLEDALSILQSTITSETHPLLDREMLKIKSSVELHAAVNRDDARAEETEESQYIDAFGTLAIRDDGAATFYGRSAGSEVSRPTFTCQYYLKSSESSYCTYQVIFTGMTANGIFRASPQHLIHRSVAMPHPL